MELDNAFIILPEFLPTPSARRATELHLNTVRPHVRFLPTPSARRATNLLSSSHLSPDHFYPRPPRGGRPYIV